jgi:outer membrane beta-barrel protein
MRFHRLLGIAASLLLISSSAFADDGDMATAPIGEPIAQDDDDDLDDILGSDDDNEESVGDEVDALRRGEIGDTVGARQESVLDLEAANSNRRVIKTIQSKTFLKLGRWELSPHVAFVSNDPFLNRYIVGTGVGYNLTEIFAIEGMLDFSPDLGTGDWKPLTTQLVEENHVSPDISKLNLFGSACFVFSPIYGKAAISGRKLINFDIYGKFGMGATRTADDLEALQSVGDPRAEATQFQVHPTTNFGGGARIIFNENLAMRVEGRSMVYIETVNATTLEMKNNFILQFSASFFIPNLRS